MPVLTLLGTVTAPGLAGQSTPDNQGTVGVRAAITVLDDFPRQFTSSKCPSIAPGMEGAVLYQATSFLALEGALSAAFATTSRCPLPAGPGAPTPIGVPVGRRSYPEHLRGATLWTSDVHLVVEPLAAAELSPGAHRRGPSR